jgi:hypothetical protein
VSTTPRCGAIYQDGRREVPAERVRTAFDAIIGIGGEKHDDAVDALVYLILGLVGEGIAPQEVRYVYASFVQLREGTK